MPKTQISVPGILVKTELNEDEFLVLFFITNGSPANPMFFTSPALRDAINMIPEKRLYKTDFGGITYLHSEIKKNEYRVGYDPLGVYRSAFEGNGIATALEKIALRELRKKVGNARIIPFIEASEERAAQLKKRGTPIQTTYGGLHKYDTTVDKLLNSIKKFQTEYRKTHRPQTPQERWARMQALGMKPRTRKPKPNKRH
jgi:hypothetical protein